jgi:glutathione S-transferase
VKVAEDRGEALDSGSGRPAVIEEDAMMKLYNFETSPYGWMARMALAEKGLNYETVEPRDRDTNPELRRLNPINKTPTLVDGDSAVFESFALLEYLDEKYPAPPLMPKDAAERARARAMALLGYIYIYPESRSVVMQLFDYEGWDRKAQIYPARRPAEKVDMAVVGPAEDRLMNYFKILDQELASRPWVTGDRFGIADIVLIPAAITFKLRGRPIHEFPAVEKWLNACMSRPSVRDTATPVVKRGTPI